MFTRGAFEKFIQDIQKQIDDADKQLHQKANNTIKNNSEMYENILLTKIADELKLAKEALERGDERAAEHYRIRVDVYKSALDAIRR